MNRRIVVLLLVFTFIKAGPLWAQGRIAELIDFSQNKVIYKTKTDQELHARSQFKIAVHPQVNYILELQLKGQGNYRDFKDIVFTKYAKFTVEKELFKPLESVIAVYSKDEKLLARYRKIYNHFTQQVVFQEYDSTGQIIDTKDFDISGPVCDDVTLVHCVKFLIAKDNPPAFYLLSNEPRMYKVRILDRGEESVALPSGSKQARKFQLMADLGPLTKLAAEFVPPTYLWYKRDYPHQWLQYEGMESGYKTANIISYTLQ